MRATYRCAWLDRFGVWRTEHEISAAAMLARLSVLKARNVTTLILRRIDPGKCVSSSVSVADLHADAMREAHEKLAEELRDPFAKDRS